MEHDLEYYRAFVLRAAHPIVESHDVAEDIAQIVLLRILSDGGEQKIRQVGIPYLCRAGRNQALQYLRNQDRQRLRLDDAMSVRTPRPPPLPDRSAELSELGEIICDALDRLPRRQREVAEWSWLHDRTAREISSELQIGEKRVQRHRKAAKERLESILRPQIEDEGR